MQGNWDVGREINRDLFLLPPKNINISLKGIHLPCTAAVSGCKTERKACRVKRKQKNAI